MTDAPEPPAAPPAAPSRAAALLKRLEVRVGAGVFVLMAVLEILSGRGIDLLLIVFNLIVAGVAAFLVWWVRDTLDRRARRRAAAGDDAE